MLTSPLLPTPQAPNKTAMNSSQGNDPVEPSSSDNSFSQTLSKEIAQRGRTDETSAPAVNATAKPGPTAAVSKTKVSSNDKEESDAPEKIAIEEEKIETPASTNDLLALVGNLSLASAQIKVSGEPGSVDGKTETTQTEIKSLQPVTDIIATDPRSVDSSLITLGAFSGAASGITSRALASDSKGPEDETGLKLDRALESVTSKTVTNETAGKKSGVEAGLQDTGNNSAGREYALQMQDAAKMETAQDLVRLNREMGIDSTGRKASNETLLNLVNSASGMQMASAQSLAAANAMLSMQANGTMMNERLAPRVGSANWDNALGQQVLWMASNGQQSASLTLNPPDLGPLQVVLNVSNDQASASFVAAQPEVRQALEAALPRLREMMSDAGIQLGQATVSANSQQQQAFSQSGGQSGRGDSADGRFDQDRSANAPMPASAASSVRTGRGLVDTFA